MIQRAIGPQNPRIEQSRIQAIVMFYRDLWADSFTKTEDVCVQDSKTSE